MCNRSALILWFLLAGPAVAEGPRVVTDIAPVHSIAAMVGGDRVTPELLLPGDSDPHHVQLRPSQRRALSQADIFIGIGPALTPWLAEVMPPNALILVDADGTMLRTHESDHDHGDIDPHAWLSTQNAITWTDIISVQLAVIDPEGADRYKLNAQTAKEAIRNAAQEANDILAEIRGQPIVTAHDAYGYFADEFGLNVVATLTDGDADRPGAAHLAELRSVFETSEIACILVEPGVSEAIAATVVGDRDIPTALVNPTGAGLDAGPDLYPDLIGVLAETIVECIGAQVP